ncbi:MAG: phage portal protein [Arhodomonas sp.]|nr:phage portal protein [Arhodomonas sp.]
MSYGTVDSTNDLRGFLESGETKSGAAVTHNTALQAQAVLACARVIAEGLAQVPLHVYRPREQGGVDKARDLGLYRVLHRKPNAFQTAYEWREMTGIHLALAGNAYSFINRVRDEVAELLPFEPGAVRVKQDKDWNITYQVHRPDGGLMDVPAENMLHLRGPSTNGYLGLDGVKLAREAIGLSLTMEEHAARFFANGANGGDLISTEQNLKQEQVDRLRDTWKQLYAGANNAYKTAIMWGGMKWQSRAVDNKLAQLYELRGFQVEDICQRMRVNPIMIGFSATRPPPTPAPNSCSLPTSSTPWAPGTSAWSSAWTCPCSPRPSRTPATTSSTTSPVCCEAPTRTAPSTSAAPSAPAAARPG